MKPKPQKQANSEDPNPREPPGAQAQLRWAFLLLQPPPTGPGNIAATCLDCYELSIPLRKPSLLLACVLQLGNLSGSSADFVGGVIRLVGTYIFVM